MVATTSWVFNPGGMLHGCNRTSTTVTSALGSAAPTKRGSTKRGLAACHSTSASVTDSVVSTPEGPKRPAMRHVPQSHAHWWRRHERMQCLSIRKTTHPCAQQGNPTLCCPAPPWAWWASKTGFMLIQPFFEHVAAAACATCLHTCFK